VLTILLGRKIPRGWTIALGLLALVGTVVRSLLLAAERDGVGYDFALFWKVGAMLWEGQDPYLLDVKPPFLYPPNAPPLLGLLALLPQWTSDRVFAVVNITTALALAPLSALVLTGHDPKDLASLSSWEVLVLGCAVVLSPATTLCVGLGQLPVLVAGFLLGALAAQSHGRHVLAGLGLGLAALKPTTTIPFLLLFLRRSDVRSWLALGIVTLSLCLITGRPTDWPGQLQAVLKTIRQSNEPGGPNDYSFANSENAQTRIGLDHTLYRLGLRNRRLIGAMAAAGIVVLGCWLFREVFLRSELPRGAACSAVALYSMLFFYHRTYDSVVLALPIVYAAGCLRTAPRSAGFSYRMVVLSCLAVLYTPRRLLEWGLPRSMEWGGIRGWAFQALVSPWATWWLLIGLVLLVQAERCCQRAAAGATRSP
jgi:hypothetical protein